MFKAYAFVQVGGKNNSYNDAVLELTLKRARYSDS